MKATALLSQDDERLATASSVERKSSLFEVEEAVGRAPSTSPVRAVAQ
jgi:hypothetical protein